MNIFILDRDQNKCVESMVDRHVVKMITEHNQLLCSAHHILGNKTPPYKLTHQNHPCSIWVRESIQNYYYLCYLNLKLCNEYTFRYEKRHKGETVTHWLMANIPDLPNVAMTEFKLAMPDVFISNDVVASYRMYYNYGKRHIAKWKKRSPPDWWIPKVDDNHPLLIKPKPKRKRVKV